MKRYKHLFLGFALLIGLSAGVSAQRGDDQKKPKPPKQPPPTVDPGKKKPPPPKKPGSGFALVWRDEVFYTA